VPAPKYEVGTNMALLAETSGVFGETAAGVTLGALREAVCKGALGESDMGRAARDGRRLEDAAADRRTRAAGAD